ncbi:hypothetical protein [Paenibacillus sp. Y412MC10]|uniref:hypothetical protein n=1 Tax=Paenibacillus TaxID=44249 RepID=UPI0011A92BD0|nr:hypothetical protein [Paenibacillus sp. Y412MC10]
MIDNYQDYDDLGLYDSVIESLEINHKRKTITFRLLKVVSRLDRNEGKNFTYKVKQGILTFEGVVFANVPYNLEVGEWSEFYRSALLTSSNLIERFKKKSTGELKHIYLGIDNGNEFNKLDIVCNNFKLELESEEFILHDNFDWLYEE